MSGAHKECAFLAKFGQPLHPFQRMHREHVNYQRQLPSDHMAHMDKYLETVAHLIPQRLCLGQVGDCRSH